MARLQAGTPGFTADYILGYALRLKRTQDFIQETKNEVLPNHKEFDRGALGQSPGQAGLSSTSS